MLAWRTEDKQAILFNRPSPHVHCSQAWPSCLFPDHCPLVVSFPGLRHPGHPLAGVLFLNTTVRHHHALFGHGAERLSSSAQYQYLNHRAVAEFSVPLLFSVVRPDTSARFVDSTISSINVINRLHRASSLRRIYQSPETLCNEATVSTTVCRYACPPCPLQFAVE